jgi:lysine-N-methylase
MAGFPARPRLADHVVARRHVVDGDERVVLFDQGTGRLVQVGPREWGLLAAADGTRDLEGIVLAAGREGAHARVPALQGFLAQLHAAGMLEDGVPEAAVLPTRAAAEAADEGAATRPLLSLPGYTLTCDGSGSCCRFYGTVLFGPVEAARARALLPLVRDGGARHERAFTPEHGSAPTGGAAVTYCDGRCAYLGDDDRCGIHGRGGPEAKPLGCQTYPASFVDDGESVRVSVSVECACVLASVDRPGGSPLVPAGARTRADLDETLVVEPLDAQVALTADAWAPRAAYVAWARQVAALWPGVTDVAAALHSLAGAVARDGLDEAATARALREPAPPTAAEVGAWAEALARRAARRAREDEGWRSPRDLVLRASRWVMEAARRIADPGTAAGLLTGPAAAPRSERFYVEALLHGHRLAGGRPLATALRDRAVRVVVARALGQVLAAVPEGARDTAAAHPLALLEAMLRGHGLDLYVEDVEG